MAYNIQLADRVREALEHEADVTEVKMFRGVCFMVHEKLCICVNAEELLFRIGPDEMETALELNGTRPMIQNGRTAKGYIFVRQEELRDHKQFEHWVKLALKFNPQAKASVKKK